MAKVESVLFNDGNNLLFALRAHDNHDGTADLIVFDKNGVSSLHEAVPHREPDDYDEEGGGRTYRNH